MPLSKGDRFKSISDLEARVEEMERSDHVEFFKEKATLVSSFIKSSPSHYLSKALLDRPDLDNIISRVKYRSLTYLCGVGGRGPGRKDRQRSTRSKKGTCQARFTVALDAKELDLVVLSVCLEHDHDTSEAAFLLMPKHRRLSDDLKDVARQHVALGANKRRIREMFKNQYGKQVTRDDLNNIVRNAAARCDDVGAQIELLAKDGFSTTVVQDEEAGRACGIFFQDEEMRRNYRAFPELLLMDATYKLVDNRAPVFTILGVDSMGMGVPLAVFLVTEETAAMIGCMLDTLKNQNAEAAAQTKVWLTDKDAGERRAIKEHFPGTRQFLCTFHVLQSFRREVGPMLRGLASKERDLQLHTLEKLAYAESEEAYWRIRETVQDQRINQYLEANWDQIRGEWVRGLSGGQMTGIFTNNHLESLHGKLKGVCHPRESFEKFVKGYGVVLSTIRTERNRNIFSETQKRSTQPLSGDLGDAQKMVTSRAFELIREQLEVVERGADDGMGQCDRSRCDCPFYLDYALPCQHIIAFRRAHAISPLFSNEIIPQRWRLTFLADELKAQVLPAPSVPDVGVRSLPRRERPRTENERYKELRDITQVIASVGAEYTGQRYLDLHENLRQVLDCVRRGQAFCVAEQVEAEEQVEGQPAVTEQVEVAVGKGDTSQDVTGEGSLRNHDQVDDAIDVGADDERHAMDAEGSAMDTTFISPVIGKRLVTAPSDRPLFDMMLSMSPLSDHEYARSPCRPTVVPQTPAPRLSPVEEEEDDDFVTSTPRTSGMTVSARRNIWPAVGFAAPAPSPVPTFRFQPCPASTGPCVSAVSQVSGDNSTLTPSPAIGRRVGHPVPSGSGALPSVSGCPAGVPPELFHLRMPTRMKKSRGRPKGTKKTVMGATRK